MGGGRHKCSLLAKQNGNVRKDRRSVEEERLPSGVGSFPKRGFQGPALSSLRFPAQGAGLGGIPQLGCGKAATAKLVSLALSRHVTHLERRHGQQSAF